MKFLYYENGFPTKQHVILIMHAFTPDVAGIKRLSKNMWKYQKNVVGNKIYDLLLFLFYIYSLIRPLKKFWT